MIKEEAVNKFFLVPSALIASEKDLHVTTVLGSCVAVCLYDPIHKVGGINHYMMPLWNGDGLATPKFGNIAIPKLVEEVKRKGAKPYQLQAKIFGGANQSNSSFNIGEKNIHVARQMLEELKIAIVASHTGGHKGRRIVFSTGTGKVQMKFIENTFTNGGRK